jgi:hypothetical protein
MSAMLGSSRRDSRPRVRLENGDVVLVDRPAGLLRARALRLLARLERLFSPPASRL